jgi:hypothetical protein
MIGALPADLRSTPATLARLASSPLGQMGGAALARLLASEELGSLQAEAFEAAPTASTVWVPSPIDDARGKGDPDRWLDMAPGGASLYQHYHGPRIRRLLGELTGLRATPSGDQAGYSFYRRAGHHLGLHRDIDACEIAVITCVYDERPPDGGGSGALLLYPSRSGESLAEIRHTPERGALSVTLTPGDSLVLLGGQIPHRLLPVRAGHTRIVAPLCYRLVA